MSAEGQGWDRWLVTGGGLLGPPPAEQELLGERIGHFELVDVLGRGGMATVYLAERRDQDFAQRAAIKVLETRSSSLADRGFRQERQILARLDHPGIARIYDGGRLPDGRLFLIMEYVSGDPIDRHCEQHDADLERRLELFAEVCDALAAAHREGIWHHDLKPENILVDRHGHPKLLDFGIARMAESGAEAGSAPLLTPRFAAPEQFRGEAAGPATDVFQLGILLHLLVCGRHPAAGARSLPELERAASRLPLELPSRTDGPWRGRLDPEFDRIVARALAPAAAARYAGVQALAADLRAWRLGRRTSVGPRGSWAAARRYRRRHPLLSVGLVAALALAAGAVYLVRERLQREQARSEAMSELVTDVLRSGAPGDDRISGSSFELPEEAMSRDPAVRRELALLYAGALLEGGRAGEAAQVLEQALATGPRGFEERSPDAPLYALLGESYRRLGRGAEARPYLRLAWRSLSFRDEDEAALRVQALRGLAALDVAAGALDDAGRRHRQALEALRRDSPWRAGLAGELAVIEALIGGRCPEESDPEAAAAGPVAAAIRSRCAGE